MPIYREFPNQLRQIALHKKDNRWRFQQSVSRLTVRAINSQTKLWICNDLNKDIGTCAIINSNILKCNVISICHLLLKQAPEIECKVASSLYSFGPFVEAPKKCIFFLAFNMISFICFLDKCTHTHTSAHLHSCTHTNARTCPHTHIHTQTHLCTRAHTHTHSPHCGTSTFLAADLFSNRAEQWNEWVIQRSKLHWTKLFKWMSRRNILIELCLTISHETNAHRIDHIDKEYSFESQMSSESWDLIGG